MGKIYNIPMLSTIITIIVVILGILISVSLHEFGHLVPAKIFKAPVSQYYVGYGPKLWSTTIGETEYGIRLIPLGGYTKILGMFPPKDEARKHSKIGLLWDKIFKKTIDDVRKEASTSGITPENQNRAFYNLTCGKKVVVMVSGTLVNFILGIICFIIAFSAIGGMSPVNRIGAFADDSPAQKAGLVVGDQIIKINGQNINSWDDVLKVMKTSQTSKITVSYLRTPQLSSTNSRTSQNIEERLAIIDAIKADDNSYKLGIMAAQEHKRLSLSESIGIGFKTTVMTVEAIATVPAQLYTTIKSFFTGSNERGSLVSIVGVGQIAVASEKQTDSLSLKIGSIISILGSLNIALFVFNLIPLLPFDGGHTINALYEGLTRFYAKIRKRPRPFPSDLSRSMPIAYIMWGLLMLMALVLILADIFKPIV